MSDEDAYRAAWFVQLVPVRTQCKRCGTASAVVHLPYGDLLFDAPPDDRTTFDVTDAAIAAFADIGWVFGHHLAYCPACKGMST